ncbi:MULTISPECIES: methyltransferase domain-containing protein [Achromobacter]|uniref:methyltransferase domain-containing protein n=1 Tax=Achromobacter TaxID=222 RepID=UPI000AFF6600|nr:methyltransferase domain-containing protein [Achromobacter spanius]MCD0499398.1 class I SAM-dependent methyltransferase [Achromobacter sp. MY14]
MRNPGYLLKRALFKLSPRFAERLNIDFRLHAPNRVFLEESVFGYLNDSAAASSDDSKTLFVGIDKHNWHYPRLLNSEFHSLDIEERKAVYGQPGRHWTGSATEMADHYGDDVFDVVVANGLLGFGVNTEPDFRRLLEQCKKVLKPGGLFVIGYNDRPDRAPFPVLPVLREFFELFEPPIAGVDGHVHRVDDGFQHVFVFLRKAKASDRPAFRTELADAASVH